MMNVLWPQKINRGPVATPAGHFFATYAPWGSGRCVSDFRFGAPQLNEPPAPVRSLLRVCIPRRRDSIITFGELDKLEAMTTVRRTKMFVRRRTRAVVFVRRSTTRLDPLRLRS